MRRFLPLALVSAAFLALSAPTRAQTELGKALKDIEVAPHWIYDDFPAALSRAKQTDKPVLVVLRCLPCPPGRALDMLVMQPDQELENLEQKFVCVRLIQANGLDLRLFQYDYEMSWVALLMNADQTIYGRYGTRTSSGPTSDAHLSRASFHKALERALDYFV